MFNTSLNNPTKGRLIESYQNGDSWYRLYSDGWCEQGGLTGGIGANWTSVNLIKPFKETNYKVIACLASDGPVMNAKSVGVNYSTRTTTSWEGVSRYYNGGGDGFGFFWYACGY